MTLPLQACLGRPHEQAEWEYSLYIPGLGWITPRIASPAMAGGYWPDVPGPR